MYQKKNKQCSNTYAMPDEAGGICNSDLQHMKQERDGEIVRTEWRRKQM